MIIGGGVEGCNLCSITFTFNRIGDGAGGAGGISTTCVLERNRMIMNKNHLERYVSSIFSVSQLNLFVRRTFVRFFVCFCFQLYELIAHKLWKLDDENTIIHTIFSLSRMQFCLNQPEEGCLPVTDTSQRRGFDQQQTPKQGPKKELGVHSVTDILKRTSV